ncbi:hypothetical protein GCM10009716_16360 [Streptomyces sodiiphilus]|uniref:Uncharacterized protein n=1 Tax=Streptomyces sodiiphilus TaxID=226217 RepID=A0ABN2NZH9_9ACTN
MSRSQLAPGVEIVRVPGEGLAVRTAEGEFLRVRTGEVPEEDLLDRLTGGGVGTPGTGRLLEAFEAAGYTGPAAPPWPRHLRRVHVLGAPALTRPLTGYLRAAGADPVPTAPGRVTAPDADSSVPRPAAVVWCLDGPVPDGLWDHADRLPGHGIAWLRCHREGCHAWLEPLAAGPGDVTSRHVRARRLAATPAHRELAAYWNGHRVGGPHSPGSAASAGLIAALLAADLTAWATGTEQPGALPANRRLRRIDVRTLRVTEHPVLPVPAVR